MKWFRLYSELLDDPKQSKMGDKTFRVFILLMCLASELEKDGKITLPIQDISWRLRMPCSAVRKSVTELVTLNVLTCNGDSCELVHWKQRQFVSSTSNERVRKYRDKRQSLGLTRGASYSIPFVLERDGNKCVYCGKSENLCVDHAFPITRGGDDDEKNLVCACKECNSGKAGRTPEDAGYTWKSPEAQNRYAAYLSQRVTVTVTAPETETETETENTSLPLCPHSEIIALYHQICPELPRVKKWTESRKTFLRSRWKEDQECQNLEWWRDFFHSVHESDYLTGKVNGFLADLEWLVRPKNFPKVIEGRYMNRTKIKTETPEDRLRRAL